MSRRVIAAAGALLLAGLGVAFALSLGSEDAPDDGLTVGWGGIEGHPSCGYDAAELAVDCTLVIDGETSRAETVTVTVTAYEDENTSQPVGSSSRRVEVDGEVHQSLVVTIPVSKAPYVDVDGETACSLSVEY